MVVLGGALIAVSMRGAGRAEWRHEALTTDLCRWLRKERATTPPQPRLIRESLHLTVNSGTSRWRAAAQMGASNGSLLGRTSSAR
jgi:hypothetical protein